MSNNKTLNTIGVIPEGYQQRFKLKNKTVAASGFLFVWTRKRPSDLCQTLGNQFRISQKGEIATQICLDDRKGRTRHIKIEISKSGAEKSPAAKKNSKRRGKSQALNTIDFYIPDVFIQPNDMKRGANGFQIFQNSVCLSRMCLNNRKKAPFGEVIRKSFTAEGYLLNMVTYCLDSMTINSIESIDEDLRPDQSWRYFLKNTKPSDRREDCITPSEFPNSRYLINRLSLGSTALQMACSAFFIQDLITKKTFIWSPVFESEALVEGAKKVSYPTMLYDRNYFILYQMKNERINNGKKFNCFEMLDLRSLRVTLGIMSAAKKKFKSWEQIGIATRRPESNLSLPIHDMVFSDGFEIKRKEMEFKQKLAFNPLVSLSYKEDQQEYIKKSFEKNLCSKKRKRKISSKKPKNKVMNFSFRVEADHSQYCSRVILEGSQNMLIISKKDNFIYIEEFDTFKEQLLNRTKFPIGEKVEVFAEKQALYSGLKTKLNLQILSSKVVCREEEGGMVDRASEKHYLRLVLILRHKIFEQSTWPFLREYFTKVFYVDYEVKKTELQTPEGYLNQEVIEGVVREGVSGEVPELPENLVESFYFVDRGIQQWALRSAVLSRDRAICWLMPNTFIDLRQNMIRTRDFDSELENLAKRLQTFEDKHFFEILMLVISLGFTYKPLLDELGICEIVKKLKTAGWSAGLVYYQEMFEESDVEFD